MAISHHKKNRNISAQRALRLLKKYGSGATSFQILKSIFQYYFTRKGCIGYVDTGNAWVAAGNPISSPGEQEEAALDFFRKAKKQKHRALFFATTDFTKDSSLLKKIPIGENVFLSAQSWEISIRHDKNFKEQIRRAMAKKICVKQLQTKDLRSDQAKIRRNCEELFRIWLSSKVMDTLDFMAAFEPFSYPEESRFFLATQNNELAGFLVAIPIYGRNGWFIEHIVRHPDAPNGTAELMIHTAIQTFKKDGYDYVSLGLTPLYKNVPLQFRILRLMLKKFYNFQGLRAFKEKLPSAQFEPVYIIYPSRQNILFTFHDVVKAFAPQGFVLFVLRTLRRRL